MTDAALYDLAYFIEHSYGLDEMRQVMYQQERRRIQERVQPGSILDIGCGLGDFLMTFDDLWTRYGFDPAETAETVSRKRGITMFNNLGSVTTGSMDVVSFRGTLQHIQFPMESLTHAVRSLKRGGLLAILATPDTDSLVYKLFGDLPALDAPKNWVLFGGRYLSNILRRLGCKEIEILHPYWSTPYARPLHDFVNFGLSLMFGYRKFAFPGNQFEMYARKV